MEPPEEGAPSPKIRVLVADNEELIVQTLAAILNLAGYEVCAVYGGEAAIRLLDLFKPDLVITDVTMPGVTGLEVAFAAQAHLPRCKILLFTAHAGLHTLLQPGPLGGLPYELITKPIRAEDLLAKLKETIRGEHPALVVPIELDEENIH
jgi:CheY-like chemotaxis protein